MRGSKSTSLFCRKGHLKLGKNLAMLKNKRSCRICTYRRSVIRRSKIKIRVLKLLGGKCVCCGLNINFWWVLTVDHIKPKRSRSIYESTVSFYTDILKGKLNKDDFQVMCQGCNNSKNTGEKCGLSHDLPIS